jgi:hypothetical protein
MLAGGSAYRAKISKTKWISSEEGGDQLIQLRTQVIDWMSWQWREGGNTYLRIWVSGYLRDKKITKKTGDKHWTPSENYDLHLKKRVLAGSNA